ncbi:class E sortase [Streptomyces spinosirectus]|uniref:class E sortase n=1 Tax=Streptomyces TaxID=1883 RepID=UPI000FFEBED9|nr:MULTISPECIES: class E sortase [Streptomyces]MBY8343734.1 class E sortase [Streptomyces plumbidurans]UIR19271.1 class E sortase [Streptomyces spinosirectus]
MTALRPERESGTSYGQEPYGASGAFEEWSVGRQAYQPPAQEASYQPPVEETSYQSGTGQTAYQSGTGQTAYQQPTDDETVALRIPEPPGGSISSSAASATTSATGTTTGGRAARRKAAKRRHGRHGGAAAAATAGEASEAGGQSPLSRVEARRQARARKPSPGVLASRAIGELFITTGVLMLLFVSYQLWWTNVRAHAAADKEASSLQNDWASGKRAPGNFAPGQGFAILHIPKLDVVVPIAEGVSNKKVLDKGMVGHYSEGRLKTAMPSAKTGNFALAGHRNTHGEPFRYINRLKKGDDVVVETQDEYYVYKMTSTLPVTSPSNTSVIGPVPPQSGFTGPGRYITLTTCTPEFTSKYRLIVWGKMVEERPRSKGKPDALVE